MASNTENIALLNVISTLIHVLLQLGIAAMFIGVALTAVRRHCHVAMYWVLAYGVGVALLALMGPLAYWGVSFATSRAASAGDAATIVLTNNAVGLVLGALNAINAVLLATGIVKVAQTPTSPHG